MSVTGTPISSGAASGAIVDQQDVVDFLGTVNLEIQSQQDPDATTISTANVQRAIDKAEARAKAILGTTFVIPLTVNGTALKNTTGSIAKPLVVTAVCQYAGFWLNKWRAVQSLGGQGNQSTIDQLANAWEAQADEDLRSMVGDDDGDVASVLSTADVLVVDLDTRASASSTVTGVEAPYIVNPTCGCREPDAVPIFYPWGC